MKYAEIIPQIRTIPKLAFFDYQIPNTFSVQPGQLVLIDFRGTTQIGLVSKIKTNTAAKKIKALQKVLSDYQLGSTELDFLKWFSQYYYISPALALKTILPPIPLKKQNTSAALPNDYPYHKITVSKNRLPQIRAAITKTLAKPAPTLLYYNSFNEKLAYYHGLIQAQTKQTLIIVPEKQEAYQLASYLKQYQPLLIHAPLAKNQHWQMWQKIFKNKVNLIIGTKIATFVPPANLGQIIIDDEEDKSHKNYDQNPRYHVRTCAQKICQLNKIKLILTSQAPSIEANYHYPKIELRQPRPNRLRLINLEDERKQKNYSWFSSELLRQMAAQKTFLLFNRKGLSNLLICQDCQEIYPQQKLTACPSCHGQRLKNAGFGTLKLAQELRQIYPNKKIIQIAKDDQPLPSAAELRQADIIIGTEYAWRHLDIDKIDFIGIISVDHQLLIPDYKTNENVFQLITKLSNLGKPLLLQTNQPDNPTIQAAIHRDYDRFYQNELAQRRLLQYPPFRLRLQKINKNNNIIIDYL